MTCLSIYTVKILSSPHTRQLHTFELCNGLMLSITASVANEIEYSVVMHTIPTISVV